MTPKLRGYAQSVAIHAPVGRVFGACTDPVLIARWYGSEAVVDLRVGGAYRVRLRDGRLREATIYICEPGRRLRLIYQPDPALPQWHSGPLVEDLIFDTKDGRTIVRVLGEGVPGAHEWDGYFLWLRRAWSVWLHELKEAVESPTPPTTP